MGRYNKYGKRRRNGAGVWGWLLGLISIGGLIFMFTSPRFERVDPILTMTQQGFWNLKPIHVTLQDQGGLKDLSVSLITSDKEIILDDKHFTPNTHAYAFDITLPQNIHLEDMSHITLKIQATDTSLWGFFLGNTINIEQEMTIDTRPPTLALVTQSYKIQKGGSAVVVFKAEDPNLQEAYIETSFGKKFIPQPFVKKGYYASLVAWPAIESHFDAMVVVRDKAGNESRQSIPFHLKDHTYMVSHIDLSDEFLDGKIAQLSNEYPQVAGVSDRLQRFKIINEKVRAENEVIIHRITSKVSKETITDFAPRPFYPLINGQKVADFADHRIYSYGTSKDFSSAYHMGIDLASTQMGPIVSSNPGRVVFSAPNGIYGNLPIIDHGFGLYSLYGHCSSVSAHEHDSINANQTIAKTGLSGYAMGDHLHFGILVQGIEVRPEEWMDATWIKDNISTVLQNAKTLIH